MWKIVTIVVLMLELCTATVRQSPRRQTQKREQCPRDEDLVDLIKMSGCRTVQIPVAVPVPHGYDSVIPALVMATRCHGLACQPNAFSCIPDKDHLTNKTIQVYGQGGRRRSPTCLQLTVEEHSRCLCGCHKSCGRNQVLKEEVCQCECDQRQQFKCEMRQRLWDPSTCTCVCPSSLVAQCSSGEVFIQELCRCEAY